MDIQDFLNYLRFERNYSNHTVENYSRDLKGFELYLKNLDVHLSWESVDSDVIRDWMESMMDKGNTATSINRRLSALRSFYRFALSHGHVNTDPVHSVVGPKKEKPLPQFVREDEMNTLLDETMWGDSFSDMRARTIIIMFYETGMRLSELVGLNVGDIDLNRRQLIVTGKRDKQRIIPFGESLAQTVSDYLLARGNSVPQSQEALFVDDKGRRMNHDQVRYVVKKNLSRVCTLKKRTPHVLRHTFATSMMNHDARIENVKKLLGHESLKTTEVYTHTTFEKLKNVYEKAHPRA